MSRQNTEENATREQRILDAAADLIIHYGYDKTTMSDIAERAGVTRAIVYLHFSSRERLVEALLYRETRQYIKTWLVALEADPNGGTLAGVFRSSLQAIRQSPFLSAMMKQDRHVFGKYLHKSGNLFEPLQSPSLWPETLQALKDVGAIREEVDPVIMGYLMHALALGILEMEEGKSAQGAPPFDALLEATADMLERVLTPDDGRNQAAGKAVIQGLARAMQASFEQSPYPTMQDAGSLQ